MFDRLKRALLLLTASVAVALMAACASPEPTPTPTPEPTPTPPPAPDHQPIQLGAGTNVGALLNAIPTSERECAAAAVGEARFQEIVSGTEPADDEALAMIACLSSTTWARVIVGSLLGDGGEVSPETMACMTGRLESLDLAALANVAGLSGEQAGQQAFGAIRSIFSAIFCLNEQERAVLGTSLMTGSMTLDQLECYFDALGSLDLDQMGTGTDGQLPPEILSAMMACGIDMMQGFMPAGEEMIPSEPAPDWRVGTQPVPGGLPPDWKDVGELSLSEDQLKCLAEALGENPLEAIRSGAALQPDIMQAMGDCRVDMYPLLP